MSRERLAWSCPAPFVAEGIVQLAHGGGGRRTRELVDGMFLPAFDAGHRERHDSAVLALHDGVSLAFTTDSYIVTPRFFPGGDIGKLAVYGTVNDLAMAGARPLYLSVAFILEEGLPLSELGRVVDSIRSAALDARVQVVTGDTKVVERGKGDGLFVNTAGVGVVPPGLVIGASRIAPGDAILLSGDVGRHGIAVLSRREGMQFETDVESDCAPLASAVAALIAAGVDLHCMRDLTRGGLATALNELAIEGRRCFELDEPAIPVADGVRGACELLGLDPLYVACEGRMVVFVPAAEAGRAMSVLEAMSETARPSCIGHVVEGAPGMVTLGTCLGGRRLLDLLSGEQLPRIC